MEINHQRTIQLSFTHGPTLKLAQPNLSSSFSRTQQFLPRLVVEAGSLDYQLLS